MKKLLKLSALLLMTSLMITACGSAPIYNVEKNTIEDPKSSKKVYRAIKEAGQSLGWKIRKTAPGVAQGKLLLRTHIAIIKINYNRLSYSIHYVKSENLKYDDEKKTIHKNYNGWIQNLEKAIEVRL